MEKPDLKENIGKALIDVAKLTFTSFVLGSILRGHMPQYILILLGVVASSICFMVGIIWTSQKPEKKGKE